MKTGVFNLFLLVALSGDFVTWAVSPEARFLTDDLCGRIVMLMS
jgi:hypothetical protein